MYPATAERQYQRPMLNPHEENNSSLSLPDFLSMLVMNQYLHWKASEYLIYQHGTLQHFLRWGTNFTAKRYSRGQKTHWFYHISHQPEVTGPAEQPSGLSENTPWGLEFSPLYWCLWTKTMSVYGWGHRSGNQGGEVGVVPIPLIPVTHLWNLFFPFSWLQALLG